jgi:hypothetical protein
MPVGLAVDELSRSKLLRKAVIDTGLEIEVIALISGAVWQAVDTHCNHTSAMFQISTKS